MSIYICLFRRLLKTQSKAWQFFFFSHSIIDLIQSTVPTCQTQPLVWQRPCWKRTLRFKAFHSFAWHYVVSLRNPLQT